MKTIFAAMMIILTVGGYAQMTRTVETDVYTAAVAAAPASFTIITQEQARQMMDDNPEAIILDVRTEAEFRERRIPGAILIPDGELGNRAAAELPDKDAVILVYCQGGVRSAKAAKELVQTGYTNAYDFGGINSWPYDTISG